MAVSQDHVTPSTPMGGNLIAEGATFRVWAPAASHVYVALNGAAGFRPTTASELRKDETSGHWTGFIQGAADGTKYRFYVICPGGQGFKRDPWARELELEGYPDCDCILRDSQSYPWHDQDWRSPDFSELIVYQFHVGVFYARDKAGLDRRGLRGRFLDVLDRIVCLADLGA